MGSGFCLLFADSNGENTQPWHGKLVIMDQQWQRMKLRPPQRAGSFFARKHLPHMALSPNKDDPIAMSPIGGRPEAAPRLP